MVLVLKALPTEPTLQLFFGLFLHIRYQVQRAVNLHAQHLLVPDLVDQNVDQGKIIDGFPITALRPDIAEQLLVDPKIPAPLLGLPAAFSREVRSGDNVLDLVLARELVES